MMKVLQLKYVRWQKRKEWMAKDSKKMYYIKIGILNKLFEVVGACCKHT